jgi:hypothetical protein
VTSSRGRLSACTNPQRGKQTRHTDEEKHHTSIPEPQQSTATTGGGQETPKPLKIALVLYSGFTALDLIEPFQMLAGVPGHDTVFLAAETGGV